MHINLAPTSSESNEIVTEILSCNHNNKKNNLMVNIETIENNMVTMKNKAHTIPSPWSINDFFNKIKYPFLKQPSSRSAADIELNNILSQGRMLSDDADTVHGLLNNKTNITPSSSLSLTTKTGVALGSLLLTSAIVGTGVYYAKRTGREPHPDMSRNTQNSSLPSISLIPSSPAKSTIQDDSFGAIDLKIKDKRNNSFPCPYIHKTKINKQSFPYTYTKRQPTVCLTKSFNQLCQRSHRQSKTGKDCHYIPRNMILKIQGYLCYCPPPDWIAMKIIEPKNKEKTTKKKKSIPLTSIKSSTTLPFIPTTLSGVNNLPVTHPANHDEMIKSRLSDSSAYIIPPKKLDTLSTNINSTNSDESEVKHISLIECANERANLTLSKTLRIISQTMNSPVSTLLKEGKVVVQYESQDQRCVNNTQFYETSKKVESAIEVLLSWIPGYNNLRFIIRVISSLLETYSDALDGNDFNMNNIDDLNSRLIGLSKDVISTISTKDINKLSESTSAKDTKNIISSLEYKKNNLMINIGKDKDKIKIQKRFNHFSDPGSNGFIFYDHEQKWNIDHDVKLNSHINEVFEVAQKKWPDMENIYFFKNSSPALYSNGVVIRYHGEIYTLISGKFYKVDETKITDTVFRYNIKDTGRPIVYKGERWAFEENSSHSVSEELHNFLAHNHKVRNNLVSKNIGHQDVSPLTPARDIQFDENFSEYLKINNQYYRIKKYQDTSYYIEGSYDIMPLQSIDNKYHLKKSILDDICCLHKEPLHTISENSHSNTYFLDNTVTSHLDDIYSESNIQNKVIIKDISGNNIKDSPNIDGAISFNGEDYIKYKNIFIKIYSNNDNTYTLGDREDSESTILIYKNKASNSYFKIPKERSKWQGLIKKPYRCRVKKQPMTACAIDYFESHRISYLLEKNSSHGIKIDDYQYQLEQYDEFHPIYQKKGDENHLYYKGNDNTFFYVRKNKDIGSNFIPTIFIIYGKDINQQIDHNNIITSVSVIKDFDTNKMIFSTPNEAQENIFSIDTKSSELYSKWKNENVLHESITHHDLVKIKEKISSLDNIPELKELFHRSGKKIITSIEHTDEILKSEMSKFSITKSDDFFNMNNLQSFKEEKTNPVIEDICSNAFKKTINNINNAMETIENAKEKLNYYLTNSLGISHIDARNNFITSLRSKLERMKMIFDEERKDNIIILTKKKSSDTPENTLSNTGQTTIGFAIPNDPLDRVFINTAMILDFPIEKVNPASSSQLEVQQMPQPHSPRSNRLYFINMIADTMLHEAVHVLGSPEDYLYLKTNNEGNIDNIYNSIKRIEYAITYGKMKEREFTYLSKIYFISNPLYKGFSIKSLNNPVILKEIFRDDSFFRAILLLNNPDTISLLIRELANPSLLPEEESPKMAVKEPSPFPAHE